MASGKNLSFLKRKRKKFRPESLKNYIWILEGSCFIMGTPKYCMVLQLEKLIRQVRADLIRACCRVLKPDEALRAYNCTMASRDRKSTRLNSSHVAISYAVFCLKKKTTRRLRG